MKICNQTEVLGEKYGDITAVKMICEAGFDALDYSMFKMKDDDCVLNGDDFKSYVEELKSVADSYGVPFRQAHAPFPTIKEGDDEYNEKMLKKVRRSIGIAGILDAGIIVVHPVYFKEDKIQKNVDMYMSLLEDAKKAGVKIALENMFGHDPQCHSKLIPNICSLGEEFAELYDKLPKEYFTCCVDIGHCYLVGSTAGEMIRTLGHDRVGCLHIHDNDGEFDWHFPPFMFDIDYEDVAKALAEIDYNGYLTLESDDVLKDIPIEIAPAMEKYMHDSARLLCAKIDSYKSKK